MHYVEESQPQRCPCPTKTLNQFIVYFCPSFEPQLRTTKQSKSWTDSQLAIYMYTMEKLKLYPKLSLYLRSTPTKPDEYWDSYVYYLLEGLRFCEIKQGTFYRGIAAVPHKLPWYSPKKRVRTVTPQSCSTIPFIAENFAKYNRSSGLWKLLTKWKLEEGDSLIILEVVGAAYSVVPYSEFPCEQEVLIEPGRGLLVDSITRQNGKEVVKVILDPPRFLKDQTGQSSLLVFVLSLLVVLVLYWWI
eukprot:TRINITY_DN27687_c0_g1_i1.p1 TRINITY_DN27687_c0_g1~~TRINITY_DN27687_c0_g1_i1.p1  ORF type:complete len:284 (-),score=39.99 TRINITY_DN27687_c0_g1_i1:9-743(-)